MMTVFLARYLLAVHISFFGHVTVPRSLSIYEDSAIDRLAPTPNMSETLLSTQEIPVAKRLAHKQRAIFLPEEDIFENVSGICSYLHPIAAPTTTPAPSCSI